ncbi:MAG: ABC transporter ATP-binding protein [Anaerolineales bacterium]|nr:MAG: ABC transporter ATP-binding protein [Anaerolineales bacterium]
MISLQGVTYSYPGTSSPALRDLSLEIPRGQFCAVIGPNGAGKTTLAYILAGFIPHFYHGSLQGEVNVEGKNAATMPQRELLRLVGLILQNPFNQISGTKVTVQDEIAFGLENLGIPREEMVARVAAAMELVGVSELAERSPLGLSGGQMQRVAIASVLVMQPAILVLDEPTSQLDPVGSREVFQAVREMASSGQMTVIMIEHKVEWVAAFADRAIALVDGALLADGEPRHVLAIDTVWRAGVGQTRYTLAARRLQELGKWQDGKRLPVTLDEATLTFKAFQKRR